MTAAAAIQERRRALAEREATLNRTLMDAYAVLLGTVKPLRDELLDEIGGEGFAMTRTALNRSSAFRSLMAQFGIQSALFGRTAGAAATDAQRGALADLRPAELLGDIFDDAPSGLDLRSIGGDVLEELIGFGGDGSPLDDLMGGAADEGVSALREAFGSGVTRGRPVLSIAKEVNRALGVPLTRAMTISRTEMHRAYREGTRQTMLANADLLEGWVWRAARDQRTCAICFGKDGTFYPIQTGLPIRGGRAVDLMASHPNCRCVMVPRAKPYSEILGDPSIPDKRVPIVTGEDRFAALSEADQRRILGPGHFERYQAGVPLAEMLGTVESTRWGEMTVLRPLRDLMAQPSKADDAFWAKVASKNRGVPDDEPSEEDEERTQQEFLARYEERLGTPGIIDPYLVQTGDLDRLGDGLDELARLQEAFPDAPIDFITGGTIHRNELAHYRPDKQQIVLNPDHWGKDAKTTMDDLDGWLAVDGPRGVLAHEYGHLLEDHLEHRATPEQQEAFATWLRNEFKTQSPVSGYARTNDREQFAELFALAYAQGGDAGGDEGDPRVGSLRNVLEDIGVFAP